MLKTDSQGVTTLGIFVSWSGEESKKVAKALKKYIPRIVSPIKEEDVWVSGRDIESGKDWYKEIIGSLKQSDFGILCLTPDNKDASWIHFEAGALAIQGVGVCPYLIGLETEDICEPLSRRMAERADKKGTLKMLNSINKSLGADAIDIKRVEEEFNDLWPEIRAIINDLSFEESTKREKVDEIHEYVEMEKYGHPGEYEPNGPGL